MTKDEALDLALEALEKSVATCFDRFAHEQVMSRPEHFINQAITAIKQARALDKKAENARELGLDYEPVGWWDSKIGFFEEKHFDQLQPLYTTPPAAQRQWVGLSHEEVMDSWDEIRDGDWAPDFYAVIEAKLKERNV
jgi:hypothetical protein